MKYPFQMSGAELEALAATGDPEAQLLLSRWVLLGWRGLAQSEARAIELLQHTASIGYPRAMRLLGDRFAAGDGVIEDRQRAETWWRNAANGGDIDAMANLVPLMQSHDPQRAAEGRHWAQVAADLGSAYALTALGAKIPAGIELAWSIERVPGTLSQMNDLVGLWLERLRPYWPQVRAATELDGEDVDFPSPDAALDDDRTLEVTILSGPRHLQLDLTRWDDGWSLSLHSFEPHPSQEEAPWLVGELRAVGEQLGLPI